jgi:hypothetical protein
MVFNMRRKKIIEKMLQIIQKELEEICQNANNEYKDAKEYFFFSHFLSNLIIQTEGLKSLNNFGNVCNEKLALKFKETYKVPSVSQLSRLNKYKDYKLFEELYYKVLQRFYDELNQSIKKTDFERLIAIDLTVITIGKGRAIDLAFKSSKSGVRMNTEFSVNDGVAINVNIVPAKVAEQKSINGFFSDKKAIYLFDRGYTSYELFDDLTKNGIRFITRLKKNATTTANKEIVTYAEGTNERKIKLGSNINKTKFDYREITKIEPESNKTFKILTNIEDLEPDNLFSMYKERWEIEVLFKWLKQNLKFKHWFGTSLNAIRIQLYCALITYLLCLIIRNRYAKNRKYFTPRRVLERLQSFLYETFDFKKLLTKNK